MAEKCDRPKAKPDIIEIVSDARDRISKDLHHVQANAISDDD